MRNTINYKSIKKTNKNSTLYVVLLLLIITLSFTSCSLSEGSEVDYSTKQETCESTNTVPATTIVPTSSLVTEQVTESAVSKKQKQIILSIPFQSFLIIQDLHLLRLMEMSLSLLKVIILLNALNHTVTLMQMVVVV